MVQEFFSQTKVSKLPKDEKKRDAALEKIFSFVFNYYLEKSCLPIESVNIDDLKVSWPSHENCKSDELLKRQKKDREYAAERENYWQKKAHEALTQQFVEAADINFDVEEFVQREKIIMELSQFPKSKFFKKVFPMQLVHGYSNDPKLPKEYSDLKNDRVISVKIDSAGKKALPFEDFNLYTKLYEAHMSQPEVEVKKYLDKYFEEYKTYPTGKHLIKIETKQLPDIVAMFSRIKSGRRYYEAWRTSLWEVRALPSVIMIDVWFNNPQRPK